MAEWLEALQRAERAQVELVQRVEQQAAVSELGLLALRAQPLQTLLERSCVVVAKTLGVEYAKVLELLPGGRSLLLRAGVGWPEGLVGRATVDTGPDSQAGYTLQAAEPVIVEDLRKETRFSGPPLLLENGVVSGMSVIIHGESGPYGVFGTHSRELRHFTQDDVSFLQAIANVLGQAIVRQQAEEALRALNQNLEQRVAERTAQLRQANQELQQFASVAAHDLQEPLRKVAAFSQMLKSHAGGSLDDLAQDYLDRIGSAVQRMQKLINDLLVYSRVITKAEPFVAVDLARVVSEVISDLEIRLRETAGQVQVGPLPELEADPVQMRQLFQNLIGNALKFHRPNVPPQVKIAGRLLPEGRPADGHCQASCQLTVEDNGIGFEEKYLDRIFAPFQRLHTRQQFEGTGMGLAVCQKIVQRHGGTITAHSRPGQGTTFLVTLPTKQTPVGTELEPRWSA